MTKTLFIGMDGATFDVLDPLTSDVPGEGVTMPFLASLLRNGYRAELKSTPHPLTPPAWTSLMTGRSPGQHGVYDFVRFEDRGSEVYFTLYDSRDIRCETIWSIASRHDKSVVSLNFPMMAPVSPINGSLVPGFVSWKHLKTNVTPPELYGRLKGINGFDPKKLAWDFERESAIGEPMTQAELESWVINHMPREEQWFRIAETLMAEDSPDMFAVMFDGTDKLQHQVWHVLDPELVAKGLDEDGKRLRKMMLGYFNKLDSYIQRLVTMAGPDAQVFFASDHGFCGTNYVFRVNRYLGELGYLTWHKTDGSVKDKRREDSNFAFLDWNETLAYCPTPSSNGVCIRVSDAPGKPGIKPEDYDTFREKLVADLYAFKDPDGNPFIKEILYRDDVFNGAAKNEAPDLTLILADHGFVSVRNKAPVLERRPLLTGTHHPIGIFIAAGPGIEKGRGEINIMDVAAVMLYSQGIPIPEDFEARMPEEIFSAEHLMSNPVQFGMATIARDEYNKPVGEVSEDDKAKILEQLKALGYLEE